EHPRGADAEDQRPDHRLCRPLGPACELPGARGGPHHHLPPTPRRPADPLDFSLRDQVSAFGEEVAGSFQRRLYKLGVHDRALLGREGRGGMDPGNPGHAIPGPEPRET
ncbi:hypothetical protein EI555_015207, partial [Monodon monoceros]